jgi:hypothetical protein
LPIFDPFLPIFLGPYYLYIFRSGFKVNWSNFTNLVNLAFFGPFLPLLLCSSHKHVLEYIFRHTPGVVVVVVVGGVVVGSVVGGVVVGSVVGGAVVVLVSVRRLHVNFTCCSSHKHVLEYSGEYTGLVRDASWVVGVWGVGCSTLHLNIPRSALCATLDTYNL